MFFPHPIHLQHRTQMTGKNSYSLKMLVAMKSLKWHYVGIVLQG